MKPEFKALNQLTDKSGLCKVKVKVIQKSQPQQSPTKPTRYQRLILKDDEGNTMKATLFNNDIETYAEALQRNGDYEISGATIQPVPEKYQSRPNEYQMSINEKVTITPLHTDMSLLQPNYHTIATIPRNAHLDDLLDVLGVVIFVEDLRTIKRGDSTETHVREIVITDHSYDRPMIISAWNSLATTDCNVLSTCVETFAVVGFTALRTRPHKGFSLSTTMSSAIILDPTGPKPDALRTWARDHESTLVDKRAKVLEVRAPQKEIQLISISDLHEKKASTTMQEEKIRVKVTFPELTETNLYFYEGCSNCGRRPASDQTSSNTCTHCNSKDAVLTPRITFKADGIDDTGKREFTLFNKEVETLFGMSCEAITAMKNQENGNGHTLKEELAKISNKAVYLELGPAVALNLNQALRWVVRGLSSE